MSYRRYLHHHTTAEPLPGAVGGPGGPAPDEEIVGVFLAGPIGALLGHVLAATVKGAGLDPATTLLITDLPSPSPSAKKPVKAKKPKPAAVTAKPTVRKRRKRRPE